MELEVETISKYKSLNQCTCNYTDGGEGISGYNHTDKTKKILSETHKGELNSQYGISPKERMGDGYEEWLKKMSEVKLGSLNPNYNNNTLRNKYRDNPSYALEKQSRKGNQNGRARKISMYKDNILIQTFDYIALCCEYLHKTVSPNASVSSIRGKIDKCVRYNKIYKGYSFKKK